MCDRRAVEKKFPGSTTKKDLITEVGSELGIGGRAEVQSMGNALIKEEE